MVFEKIQSTFEGFIAICLIAVGALIAWVLFWLIGKWFGIILIAIGILIIIYFPHIGEYQPKGFTRAGLLFGAILIIAGAMLLILG